MSVSVPLPVIPPPESSSKASIEVVPVGTAKLLLLLRTGGRGASHQDLELALHSFDRLHVSTAQRAVRFYQTRQNSALQSAAG